MYIPKYASTNNSELIHSFMLEHSFGTLISTNDETIEANHFPFLIKKEDEQIILYTHLARSNPQWTQLNSQNCLVVFTGPHLYMSPTYYVDNLNVPTWSYTAVHANCRASVISDMALEKNLMKEMVTFYERKNNTDWNYELPEEFHNKLLAAIVWIRLDVTKLEGKFKLSQNRNKADYQNILKIFAEKKDDNTREVLRYMELTSPEF
jgi:transcriptional regulator